ncbi:DUF2059 domain-containing protein [Marivita sp. S6314]|uniref:DUF2059 domain-containing protein n=1 Tax=Marivita sp. S6314 TaxID=2926406 RepID=UPI001FF5FF4A|nr:DUF2059 domain-containing protein [Marivita sp. S6314]MCK0151091.1 DUF2059 domain-containing protein [Marivita sp. S6314]
MLRNLIASAATALVVGPWATSVQASSVDDLLKALGVPQIVEIMREEGIEYGETLARDMVPGGRTQGWDATVERIYDDDRMLATVREEFKAEFGDADIDPLLAFFTSEVGQQVVSLELSARTAMREQEIEDAARAAFRDLEGTQSETLAMISEFVDTNDLVDANLVGALNANYMFYLGLVDGGALDMSEQDILTEVWSSEAETRSDTREWVYAFLIMAYRPLEDGVVADYTELSKTDPGRALNRALFAGFNKMYDDISYALGRAVARQMQVQEL